MEYYVVNQSSTLLVTRNQENNGFIIQKLSATNSDESIFMKDSQFYGSTFKYPSDFLKEFLKEFLKSFRDKHITNFIVSTQASESIMKLMDFNRIDS